MEYGPEAAWPDHQNAEWCITLKYARERGWFLTTHSGHTWGTLVCEKRACKFKVFSTGKGTDGPARGARKKVDECTHGSAGKSVLADIEDRIRKADLMVTAAESMAAKEDAESAAMLLDDADALLVDANWSEFDRLVDDAERFSSQIQNALSEVGLPGDSKPGAVVATAAKAVAEVRGDLGRTSGHAARVRDLKQQNTALARRVPALRKRFGV